MRKTLHVDDIVDKHGTDCTDDVVEFGDQNADLRHIVFNYKDADEEAENVYTAFFCLFSNTDGVDRYRFENFVRSCLRSLEDDYYEHIEAVDSEEDIEFKQESCGDYVVTFRIKIV